MRPATKAIGRAAQRPPVVTISSKPSTTRPSPSTDSTSNGSIMPRRVDSRDAAEGPGGNATLAVDDDRARDRLRRKRIAEEQLQPAVTIDDVWVLDAESRDEAPRRDVRVSGVESDELHTPVLEVTRDRCQGRRLGAAGRAPGGPYVEHDHLAEMLGQAERLAIEALAPRGQAPAGARTPRAPRAIRRRPRNRCQGRRRSARNRRRRASRLTRAHTPECCGPFRCAWPRSGSGYLARARQQVAGWLGVGDRDEGVPVVLEGG